MIIRACYSGCHAKLITRHDENDNADKVHKCRDIHEDIKYRMNVLSVFLIAYAVEQVTYGIKNTAKQHESKKLLPNTAITLFALNMTS